MFTSGRSIIILRLSYYKKSNLLGNRGGHLDFKGGHFHL